MSPLVVVFIISIGLANVSGISKEEYPNPSISPRKCWKGLNPPEKLKVCDPDKILPEDEAEMIQEAVERVSSSTSCPCGDEDCHIQRLAGARGGFKISVALVGKMEESNTNLVAAAKAYATYLRRNRHYYGYPFARCEEDIIIFLSYEDRVVYVLTGQKVRVRLSDDDLKDMIVNSRSKFSESVYSGLNYLITNIQESLE